MPTLSEVFGFPSAAQFFCFDGHLICRLDCRMAPRAMSIKAPLNTMCSRHPNVEMIPPQEQGVG